MNGKKIKHILTVALIVLLTYVTACNNASVTDDSQSVQNVNESGEEIQRTEEKAVINEEKNSVEMPLEDKKNDNAEQDKIEISNIEEKYEYLLYEEAGQNMLADIIGGFNLPEGWTEISKNSFEYKEYDPNIKDFKLKEIFEDGVFKNENEDTFSIFTDAVGINRVEPYDDDEGIYLENERKATLSTPFGNADIFYWKMAVIPQTYDNYEYWPNNQKYEADGIRYLLDEREYAVITVGECSPIIILYDKKEFEGEYTGELETLIPLLFEAK